jgi:hypothetical protein
MSNHKLMTFGRLVPATPNQYMDIRIFMANLGFKKTDERLRDLYRMDNRASLCDSDNPGEFCASDPLIYEFVWDQKFKKVLSRLEKWQELYDDNFAPCELILKFVEDSAEIESGDIVHPNANYIRVHFEDCVHFKFVNGGYLSIFGLPGKQTFCILYKSAACVLARHPFNTEFHVL